MALADFSSIDALWIVLSVFLVVVGGVLAYSLLRLSSTFQRLTSLLEHTEKSVIPLTDKLGGTLDRVNLQLDKVDIVTDSAVDAADAADTAVRAVSMAVTRPVQKASGIAKGISHGTAALFAGHDLRTAVAAGRDAAARREREVAEELARTDARRTAYLRPDSRPRADAGPSPAPAPAEPETAPVDFAEPEPAPADGSSQV